MAIKSRKQGRTQDIRPIDATLWQLLLGTHGWTSVRALADQTDISPRDVAVMLECWVQADFVDHMPAPRLGIANLDVCVSQRPTLYRLRDTLQTRIYSRQVLG